MDILNIIRGRRGAGPRQRQLATVDAAAQAPTTSAREPDGREPTTTGSTTPADGEKLEAGEPFLVGFEDGDGLDPQRWSPARKIVSFVHVVAIAFWNTLAASALAPTYTAVAAEFAVNRETSELSTSMFLFGFALGSIVMAPLSEEFGRLPIYIVSMAVFGLMHVGAALAPNMATLAVCRFIAGLFGTSPLSNAGGSLVDMYSPLQTTLFFPIFGSFGFIGPTLGPLIGAALTQQYGWRWTYWVMAIVGLLIALSCFLFMQESYAPVVLDHKARAVRRATGDARFQSAHEKALAGRSPFNRETFARPFVFAFTQPIVAALALYLTVVYVVLFADLEAYPLVYEQYGFNLVEVGLAFLPIGVGIVLVLSIATAYTYALYRRAETERTIVLTPETRLYTLLWACWLIPLGLFWIAWTSFPSLSPWASLPSGVLFGGGLMIVFVGSYMYVMACYGAKSSSALSVLTLIRYSFSGLAVHAAEPWFTGMGLQWAFSLLAFVSLALCAIPFVFYRWGPTIRARSKFIA